MNQLEESRVKLVCGLLMSQVLEELLADDTEFRLICRGRGECDFSQRDRVFKSVTENKHEQRTSQVAGGRWLETGRQVTGDMCKNNVCH